MAKADPKPPKSQNKTVISLRIDSRLRAQLDRMTDRERDPLAPSISQVTERGLVLAMAEFSKRLAK